MARAGRLICTLGLQNFLILGVGPNRIGQGIEFDYCCVHVCFALKRMQEKPLGVQSLQSYYASAN